MVCKTLTDHSFAVFLLVRACFWRNIAVLVVCGGVRVGVCVDLTVWCGVGIVFVVAPGGCKPLRLFVVVGL